MALINTKSARSILLAAAAYFAVCGLSATFAPSSWLWVSGLPTAMTNELSLAFGVVGAFISALAIGALIASTAPTQHRGLILTLAIANVCDFLATLRATVSGALPWPQGTLFIVVTVVWTTLLFIAWRCADPKPCASDFFQK